MSQGVPIQQLPLEIVGVATMHKLGTPERVFGPAREPLLGRIMGYFSILTGLLIIVTFIFTYQSLFSGWPAWQVALILLVALAWLALGAWILLTPMNDQRLRVFICPDGLIYAGKKPEVIHWNQMERIWKNVMGNGAEGTRNNHKDDDDDDDDDDDPPVYIIRRSDDALFTFDDSLEHVVELGLLLEREITRRLLPRALVAFDAGGTVVFDEIVVSRRGVGVKEGRRWLAWQEFAGVSMGKTSITIYQKGNGVWATVKLARVPNVEILQRLVEYIVREQARRQLPQVISYNAGRVVRFGAIRVSQQNLVINNDQPGKITLDWNEIASIAITPKEVLIRRQGPTLEWYTLPAWMVDDAPILQELIEYIMRFRKTN